MIFSDELVFCHSNFLGVLVKLKNFHEIWKSNLYYPSLQKVFNKIQINFRLTTAKYSYDSFRLWTMIEENKNQLIFWICSLTKLVSSLWVVCIILKEGLCVSLMKSIIFPWQWCFSELKERQKKHFACLWIIRKHLLWRPHSQNFWAEKTLQKHSVLIGKGAFKFKELCENSEFESSQNWWNMHI